MVTWDHENQNRCLIFIEQFRDPSMDANVVLSFTVIYSIQFVLGFCGNSAVLLLTMRERKLQTVQNLFMLNLALSDLIVCIFSLPITPVTNIYKNWLFGESMCQYLPWLQGTSMFIATFSLAIIAIDRYCLIVKPHWTRLAGKNAKYVMFCLWVLCALMTLPYSWYMELVTIEGFCGQFCTEQWPDGKLQRVYAVFVTVSQFIIPFTIMFFCYIQIFAKLKERTNAKLKKLNERSLILAASMPIMGTFIAARIPVQKNVLKDCQKKCELLAQTRKNTLVLLLMVVVFGFSCLPHNLSSAALDISEGDIFIHKNTDYTYLVNLVTHSIAMMNNVVNPILYGFLNPRFVDIIKKTCADVKSSFHKRLDAVNSTTTMV